MKLEDLTYDVFSQTIANIITTIIFLLLAPSMQSIGILNKEIDINSILNATNLNTIIKIIPHIIFFSIILYATIFIIYLIRTRNKYSGSGYFKIIFEAFKNLSILILLLGVGSFLSTYLIYNLLSIQSISTFILGILFYFLFNKLAKNY